MSAKDVRGGAVLARIYRGCVLCIHRTDSPSKEEWDGVLRLLLDELALGRLRILVWTEGGAPDATQRAKLRDALSGANPPIAVLSSSPLVRAACTAISWFNPQMRNFSPGALPEALSHLGIERTEHALMARAFEEAKAELFGSRRTVSRL